MEIARTERMTGCCRM